MSARIVSLDLLRGLAAGGVAIPHFLLYFGVAKDEMEAASAIAVEVFFVLSGFVLAPQILFVLEQRTASALSTFLVRRWMRTVPPYLIALLLISALFHKIGSADFFRYAFYVQNLVGQHLDTDYYPVAWSLSVEEWFYLVFPVFLLLTTRRLSPPAFYIGGAVFFVMLISLMRMLTGDGSEWGSMVRRIVLYRIDSIVYGFLLYLAFAHTARPPVRASLLLLPAAVGLGAWAFDLLLGVGESAFCRYAFPFVAAAFGASCISACVALEPLAEGPRIRTASEVSGRLSYAVYLYHLLPLYVLAQIGESWDIGTKFAAFFIGTAFLACLSAYLVEQPVLALRPSYSSANNGPATPSRSVQAD